VLPVHHCNKPALDQRYDAALAEPVNGTVEIDGPSAFHMDEIVGRVSRI
jgi:hypothetical protein